MAVNADRQYLGVFFFLFSEKAFQLAELLRTVGSPLAPVKYQHDVPFVSKIAERYSRSVNVFKGEIRRYIAYLNSFKVGSLQIFPIFSS